MLQSLAVIVGIINAELPVGKMLHNAVERLQASSLLAMAHTDAFDIPAEFFDIFAHNIYTGRNIPGPQNDLMGLKYHPAHTKMGGFKKKPPISLSGRIQIWC